MAARISELEPRLLERLRAELAELIAAAVAYPPFFDFRANRQVTRPIDRARMDEIQHFLSSVNFGPIERADVTAPETRRFIERLILRYLEVNEGLRGRYAAHYLPRLRALAPRLAADAQRRAVGYVNGSIPDFGARRQAMSWASVSRRESGRSAEERERATRVLESALLQRPGVSASAPAVSPARQPASPPPAAPADPWRGLPNDVTIPVPATAFPDSRPGASPFEAFAPVSGPPPAPAPANPAWRVSEQPTGPLAAAPPTHGQNERAAMRELPPDLYELYGDYLGDMEPEAPVRAAPPTPPSTPPFTSPPPRPAETRRDQPPTSANARNDQLIFWQLRYQLEAYVRRAARSYGVPHQGGDPATVLDELRRSGFVDEADLRIAEGVFALTDRVTAQGHATEQEYRQALMLYLLYHRSHLNI